MIKLAARIFDIYDDHNFEVASKLGSEFATVKVAERDEIEALHDHQFALVMKTAGGVLRRRFPLHNEDAIKLSAAYFAATRDTLPPEIVEAVEKKLANPTSADVAYVDATVLKPPREKVAYTEQHWGLTIEGRNFFPLHDAELVKTAATRYPFTAEGLEPEERFLYARNILKRASALNVPISEDSPLHLYSNDEVNLESLKVAIDERKRIMKAAGLGTEVLDQLAEAAGCPIEQGDIETQASFKHRTAKLASRVRSGRMLDPARIIGTLQNVDKLASIGDAEYFRGLADPFAACFKADFYTKRAAMIVDGVDLSRLSLEKLAENFDPGFVQEFNQQPAQVYISLPDPIKAVIRQLAMGSAATSTKANPTGALSGDPQVPLDPIYANSVTLGS